MIGIIIVAHGGLADEFLKVLEQVTGPQPQTATLSVQPSDDVEGRRKDLLDKIASVDSGQGVVLLTDMFGGTPSNLAMSVIDEANIEVLAGVNLPTLVKLVSLREGVALSKAITQAREAGVKYMNLASQLLEP